MISTSVISPIQVRYNSDTSPIISLYLKGGVLSSVRLLPDLSLILTA